MQLEPAVTKLVIGLYLSKAKWESDQVILKVRRIQFNSEYLRQRNSSANASWPV